MKYISKDNLTLYDNLIKDYIKNKAQNLQEIFAYGVQFNVNVADPHLTRIGNMSLHKSLPIQSELKGCIAKGGKVVYWLHPDDWRFRKNTAGFILQNQTLSVTEDTYSITNDVFSNLKYDKQYVKINEVICKVDSIDTASKVATISPEGTLEAGTYNVELGAVLNGYDGTVRVYCPEFYIKSESEGDYRRVWLSTIKLDATWTKQESLLIDAYRSTILNTVPLGMGYLSTLPANSAISVVNTNAYCRGGGNRSEDDQYLATDSFRTDLGKPRTNISRATMRTYSRNASSQMLSYDQYKNIFYWLYVVEYANFQCQDNFKEELTKEGFRQGGLGLSIAAVNKWTEYNGNCPLTPCGYGNTLGNGTGLVSLTIPEFTYGADSTIGAAQTMQMARWRGFDNPFGDIWTNLDGIIIDADADNHPNNMNYVYTCQDASKYADTLNDTYVKVGEEIRQDGFTMSFDLGDAAHIIPHVVTAEGASEYICDYHSAGSEKKTLCTLLVGGDASIGAGTGLGCFCSSFDGSFAHKAIGFRSVSGFMSFSSDK